MKNSNWRHAELLNHWIKTHVILSSIAILILIGDAMDTKQLHHLILRWHEKFKMAPLCSLRMGSSNDYCNLIQYCHPHINWRCDGHWQLTTIYLEMPWKAQMAPHWSPRSWGQATMLSSTVFFMLIGDTMGTDKLHFLVLTMLWKAQNGAQLIF